MRAFLDELRRRGVTRAAAVYAIAAWAVIEATATIFPALHLPDWTVSFVVVLALIGFPVALVTAWIFDLTRSGIVRTPDRDSLPAAQTASLNRGRAIDFVIIGILALLVAWLGWERLRTDADGRDALASATNSAASARLDSIAVLPFVNLSGDPENEYFGDGLAEELLNVLVRIEGLRVTARTSSFQYKGQNLDIREIARALGVVTVLEGSVRKAGDRVRVTAQLIRAADGSHLWSETFDRKLADIFAVQDEISLAIADALRVTLGHAPDLSVRPTDNVAAFEAYLRGRFAMHQRTTASLNQAVEDFRAAIALDPDYAAAYSGLSDSYLLLASYGNLSSKESLRLAEPMARRALELDPELAEAHASFGLLLRDKGDKEGSVSAFQQAIALNPSYSPAHHWLALSYQDLGRFREAGEALRASLEVDPGYVSGKRVLLGLLRITGEHAHADAFAAELARDHAGDALVLYALAGDAFSRNRLVDAVRYASEALQREPDAVFLRVFLATLLGMAGDIDRADAQIALATKLAPEQDMVQVWPLQRAVYLGDVSFLEANRSEVLARISDVSTRATFGCVFASTTGRSAAVVEACGAVLQRANWQENSPLPAEIGNMIASMIFAYADQGDVETSLKLRRAAQQELVRLAAEGMSEAQLHLFDALLKLYDDDDAEPILSALPEWVEHTPITPLNLQSDPSFARLREEPRFLALVEQMEQRRAQMLAEIRQIEIP